MPVSLTDFSKRFAPLRIAADLSIEELAAKAGVSAGLVSQLERGLGNPSFNTLAKLAYALGVPVGTFFQGGVADQAVVRRNARKKLVHSAFANRSAAPVYELLTPDLQRKLEVIWVELPPGESNEEAPFMHDTEECGVLLSGTLEVHLGDDVHTLNAGDSISFRGLVPHWYRNPGDEPAVSIWIVTPPSF